jgi:hypothetical protein
MIFGQSYKDIWPVIRPLEKEKVKTTRLLLRPPTRRQKAKHIPPTTCQTFTRSSLMEIGQEFALDPAAQTTTLDLS